MRRAGERAGWLMERLMERDGRKALRCARAPAWIQWGVVVFACALPATAEATCEAVALWDRLPRSAAELVGVEPLMLAVGAVAAPAVLAPSGADHELRVLAQGRLSSFPQLGHFGPLEAPALVAADVREHLARLA